jgi:pantothenate kinase
VLTGRDALLARVDELRAAAGGGRVLLGLAGEPGSGKSTVAVLLAEALVARGVPAVVVPMDGWHLSGRELDRLGRAERKGAPDTFDAGGYLALLRRLRLDAAETVWAPDFRREIEEAVAGSVAVDPAVQVVVSEGNYLLVDDGSWRGVADAFDAVWFVDAPADERLRWLVARHERYGKAPEAALAWATGPDEANARLVRSTRGRADDEVDGAALWAEAAAERAVGGRP